VNFVVLSDNKPLPGNDLVLPEHGFSLYFELEGRRFLYDTGASGKFIRNAAQFGIDISCVDVVIISHGHNDHTGGLREFFRINKRAKVYLSSEILFNDYYTCRRGPKRMLSMDKSLFNEFYDRFVFLNDDTEIFPGITLFFTKDAIFSMPVANKFLFVTKDGVDYKDNFFHEISIIISGERIKNIENSIKPQSQLVSQQELQLELKQKLQQELESEFQQELQSEQQPKPVLELLPQIQSKLQTEPSLELLSVDILKPNSLNFSVNEFSENRFIDIRNGDIVISACSHMGLLNILDKASVYSKNVNSYIGGLHLVDGDFDSEEDIIEIRKALIATYPQIQIFTGHCTSDKAIQLLKGV